MFQMDVISLFPLDVLYVFTGVKSLLRFPRLLKVKEKHAVRNRFPLSHTNIPKLTLILCPFCSTMHSLSLMIVWRLS